MNFLETLWLKIIVYPQFRSLTPAQADAVVGLMAAAVYADEKLDDRERASLESQLGGLKDFWTDEKRIHEVLDSCHHRFEAGEDVAAYAGTLVPVLAGVPLDFAFLVAVVAAQGYGELTASELTHLRRIGTALGLGEEDIDAITADPEAYYERVFPASLASPFGR